MQLSKEWECLRDNCYIQHHLSWVVQPLVSFACAKWGLWHEIWVLQVAERVGWDLAEQHGPGCGPQVRRDSRVQLRPCLSQFSKKENIYSEMRAWLVFIPIPPSATQSQNCNCSNQPHRRNFCFNKSFFSPLPPKFLQLLLSSSNEIITLWPQMLLPGINVEVNSTLPNWTVESNKYMEGVTEMINGKTK